MVEEARPEYENKLQLLLTLVGYAVGFGNIWRFPYLTYSYGGGAFLIPYAAALLMMGLPLFVLELGLGQMLRQGTLGVWSKLNLPRLRGVGMAATICTFFVSLYYNVILAWTIYYLGRTIGNFGIGHLPWSDEVPGFSCPQIVLYPQAAVAGNVDLIDAGTGLFNPAYRDNFWCPEAGGIPGPDSKVPAGYTPLQVQPTRCPAWAAVQFWEKQALQQSSGLDDLAGFHGGMLIAFTVSWVIVYICICQGIASSGRVVYVTATLPYIALVTFFFRAITLPNASTGVSYYLKPDPSFLLDYGVWQRAVTQIFYSLGVGFGSLIAFASYNKKESDYVMDATKVCFINCGTSFFAGFVVFPVLGFLASEMGDINPCISSDRLNDLNYIGLSGPGLAFIAFPIAISKMSGSFFWAMIFFVMLVCLGIDSQFAMCESVVTVLQDAGVGKGWPKPIFSGLVCVVSYACGLIFVTRAGVYWFSLFDYYTCVVAMFFVTLLECIGVMWCDKQTIEILKQRTQEWTKRSIGSHVYSWKYTCPVLLVVLLGFSVAKWDLMNAEESKPYPLGSGYYPGWSVWVGWTMGVLPIIACAFTAMLPVPKGRPLMRDLEPATKGELSEGEEGSDSESTTSSSSSSS